MASIPAASGCDIASDAATGNLGVAGASCLRSPDCEPPLQCIANVCADPDASAAGSTERPAEGLNGAGASDDGMTSPGRDDVADAGPVLEDVSTSEPADTPAWLVDLPFVDTDAHGPLEEDTASVAFSECEELGIEPDWAGAFIGSIDYDIDTAGLIPPSIEVGTIDVTGNLAFSIECIDSKLVVQGVMSGIGDIIGDDPDIKAPFNVKLAGFYSPSTETLTAQMVDGVVDIFTILEIYFEGTFNGSLTEFGDFEGTWAGTADETNVEVITGLATGGGTWLADPVE